MRLRLLKLACLVLVLALAGGLIVFNFADDDLQSAFIQTSSVTPATGIDAGAQAPTNPAGVGVAPDQSAAAPPPAATATSASDAQASAQSASDVTQAGSGQGAAFAPIAPSANDMSQNTSGATALVPLPAPAETASSPTSSPADSGTAVPAAADETAQAAPAAAATAPTPATTATPPAAAIAEPAPMPAADASSTASSSGPAEKPVSKTAAAAPQAADAPPADIASINSSESSYAAVVWPEGQPAQGSGSEAAAAAKPQAKTSAAAPVVPPVTHHRRAKPHVAASAAPVQAAEKPTAPSDQSTTARAASAAPSPPPQKLIAQVAPPHAAAKRPLAPSPSPMPASRESDFAAHLAVGPQMLIEFPNVRSNASGSLAGSGSVTNSSARVIPGIVGSWTSAPLADLPLKPSFGGSLFIGAPASGDSVASATTSGGYTLKLGQTNDWPVIMPRFFMGLPVADGTRASFGTGIWVNNVKETATLANGSGSQSDERKGVMMRPFLSAAIEQHAPLFGFLPSESQRLKVSGGYIFGDSTFSASFCAAGQTCVRTQDQGSWFLGLSFQMGFPAGGAPAP